MPKSKVLLDLLRIPHFSFQQVRQGYRKCNSTLSFIAMYAQSSTSTPGTAPLADRQDRSVAVLAAAAR